MLISNVIILGRIYDVSNFDNSLQSLELWELQVKKMVQWLWVPDALLEDSGSVLSAHVGWLATPLWLTSGPLKPSSGL